jgi:hypothetical protein
MSIEGWGGEKEGEWALILHSDPTGERIRSMCISIIGDWGRKESSYILVLEGV